MATVSVPRSSPRERNLFPINRRHQRMATQRRPARMRANCGFQSIGVTKEWRRGQGSPAGDQQASFQSIGVTKEWRRSNKTSAQHSTGCFQSIGVTKEWRLDCAIKCFVQFRWGFQSIGVTKEWRQKMKKIINSTINFVGFQSIGVTKEWRLRDALGLRQVRGGFQSIGVTKEWRQTLEELVEDLF